MTIEEEVKAVTAEPTPTVAKPVEAPKPTADKAVIISTPSKDERIEAKAIELAKAAGKNYATAVSAIRGYYRKGRQSVCWGSKLAGRQCTKRTKTPGDTPRVSPVAQTHEHQSGSWRLRDRSDRSRNLEERDDAMTS